MNIKDDRIRNILNCSKKIFITVIVAILFSGIGWAEENRFDDKVQHDTKQGIIGNFSGKYIESNEDITTQVQTSGGPDYFGYTFSDSNTVGGPAYNWIDITSTGTRIMPDSDDAYINGIPVGFFFNFYGQDYSHISIANNGLVLASGGTGKYINDPIGNSVPHNFISPFWDDIVTWGSAGAIYYQTIGTAPNRIFVIEWYDNQHFDYSTSGITFEAILYEGTNNIKFQYRDIDFGTVYGPTPYDLPPYNNGGSATVGIEGPDGRGLQYSYNRQVIYPGLAILFKFPAFKGTNMRLSKNAPDTVIRGYTMTYSLYYNNFGTVAASNVVLIDNLPANVVFVSASDGGIYDSTTRRVRWNIGSVAAYPSGRGFRSVTVRIPNDIPIGALSRNTASITTSNIETRYDDNTAIVSTTVTENNLPPNVYISPLFGNPPWIPWHVPITFTYYSTCATNVRITIHFTDDQGPDIISAPMTETSPDKWTYTTTFNRMGQVDISFIISGCPTSIVKTKIYVDPAGHIYDIDTGARISGANVWLQRPDTHGGWQNVPTGQAIMSPDRNPLVTGANGQYQWNVLPGAYRVHVDKTGYYSKDSIVVNIPPPVTDLHVGLKRTTSANILKNSGFEESDGAEPRYWDRYQTGSRAIFTYPEIGRIGGKSVAIKYTTKEINKVALWWQPGITVSPSKQYKLSGYMKLASVTGGNSDCNPLVCPRYNGASLRVNWLKSDGAAIKVDLITKSGTSGWTKYEKTFTAPSNAVRATVGGDLFNCSGKVWFDDIEFVKIS